MHKFSIITATRNNEETITTCLKSLHQQTFPIEHIVIDGASTDLTLNLVKEHSPESCVVSEKDNGLYDALNKGLQMATGGIVGILHADDFYADPKVLERVATVFDDPDVGACYGDLVYVARDAGARSWNTDSQSNLKTDMQNLGLRVVRYWRSGQYQPSHFYWGWMPPHPTFFVRKSIYVKYGLFNLDLGTAADYELMLRFLLKHQIVCRYVPDVLVCMRTGGVSNASLGNRWRANRNDRKAWEINGLRPWPWTILLKPLRKVSQYFLKP